MKGTMQVSGSVLVRSSPAQVLASLQDMDMIGGLLPASLSVVPAGENRYQIRMDHLGHVPLGLKADLTMTPRADGCALGLSAGNFATGRLSGETDLTVAAEGPGCRLGWTGALQTSGLVGHVLSGQDDAVARRVERLFRELAARIEAAQPGVA